MIDAPAWLPYLLLVGVVGLPALVGVAAIVGGVRQWSRQRALAGSGERAGAEVVDNQMQSWSGGRTTFRPVVTFRTLSGQEVKAAVEDLDDSASHIVGTRIEVFYDPAEPAKVTSGRGGGGNLTTSIIFGLLFLGFALVAYLGLSAAMADFGGGFGGFGGGGEEFSDFEDFEDVEGP